MTDQAFPWTPPTQIRVDGASYRVRLDADGFLEVFILDAWRSQRLFTVYDDISATMVAGILVHRFGKASRAGEVPASVGQRKPPTET